MTNKEAIGILKEYFLKNDPKEVAQLCAGLVVDLNRFSNFVQLSEKSALELMERTAMNMSEFNEILKCKEKRDEPLNIIKVVAGQEVGAS